MIPADWSASIAAPPARYVVRTMTPHFCLHDLPIPDDVVAGGPDWSPLMIEMADHVGAYRTLLICDRFGGWDTYIAQNYRKNALLPVIDLRAARKISQVFGRQTLRIPLARNALLRARRGPVLAAVRAGFLSIGQAARMVGMRRENFSRALNQTDEGIGVAPIALPIVRNGAILLDAAGVATAALLQAGADVATIDTVQAEIARLGELHDTPASEDESAEARALFKKALDARAGADARGDSLVEPYRLMCLADAAGAIEASSHLLDMAEEMTPLQRSIARGTARLQVNSEARAFAPQAADRHIHESDPHDQSQEEDDA